MGKSRLIILLFTLTFLKSFAQKDSIEVVSKFNDFYNWYFNSLIDWKNSDYKPKFDKDSNGMATLIFDKYVANLTKYHFSDSLIKKEINSYKTCLDNLQKMTFEEFNQLDDIDDLENIDCNFSNYFRWVGDNLEYPKNVMIIDIVQFDNITIKVHGSFFDFLDNGNEKYFWGYGPIMTFKLINDKWKINNIEFLK